MFLYSLQQHMKIQSCLQYFNDSVLLEQDDRLLWYYIIKMQDF